MIEREENVLRYAGGMDMETFIAYGQTCDAVLRNTEPVDEAASHVPGLVREVHTEIEWRLINATRNRVAHRFPGIDDKVVWDVIETAVPDLNPELRLLLWATRHCR